MWDDDAIEMYTAYLTVQEQAVLEALAGGIERLEQVKTFVNIKLDGDVDNDYIAAVWSQHIEVVPYLDI